MSKNSEDGMRIAKRMARAGVCSRRDAERMIEAGRVRVNGKLLKSPALNVFERDTILVDEQPLPQKEPVRLWRYHKPHGEITSHKDEQGRPTVFDAMPKTMPRVISIGRLDYATQGLLLMTNDGELARHLELPSTGWRRRYKVRAFGKITQDRLDALSKGLIVEGVRYAPIEAKLERDASHNQWLMMALSEGKNREVRRVLEHLGLKVNRLIRLSYGPFQLGELKIGAVEEVKRRILAEQLGQKLSEQFDLGSGQPQIKPRAKIAQRPSKSRNKKKKKPRRRTS